MHQIDSAADVGKIQRILQRRVAAADDGDVFSPEKRAVAGGAVAHAAAGERFLTGAAEFAALHAVRNNNSLCLIALGMSCYYLGVGGKLCLCDGFKVNLRAKRFCLRVNLLGEFRPCDAGDGGIIFNFIRNGNLATIEIFLQQDRAQPRPLCIDSRSQSGAARADDDNIRHK